MSENRVPRFYPTCQICQKPIIAINSQPIGNNKSWNEKRSAWESIQLRVCMTADACNRPDKWREVMEKLVAKSAAKESTIEVAVSLSKSVPAPAFSGHKILGVSGNKIPESVIEKVREALTLQDLQNINALARSFVHAKARLGKCVGCNAPIGTQCIPSCVYHAAARLVFICSPADVNSPTPVKAV